MVDRSYVSSSSRETPSGGLIADSEKAPSLLDPATDRSQLEVLMQPEPSEHVPADGASEVPATLDSNVARRRLPLPVAMQRPRAQAWLLRVLLAFNLLLWALIAFSGLRSSSTPRPQGASLPADSRFLIEADPRYTSALEAASRNGDYARAIELMQAYLADIETRLDPQIVDVTRGLLARYLHLDGRSAEAVEVERAGSAWAGFEASPLWDELLTARSRGDAETLRRASSRLLLKPEALSPIQYEVVAEAWLKLGSFGRR